MSDIGKMSDFPSSPDFLFSNKMNNLIREQCKQKLVDRIHLFRLDDSWMERGFA